MVAVNRVSYRTVEILFLSHLAHVIIGCFEGLLFSELYWRPAVYAGIWPGFQLLLDLVHNVCFASLALFLYLP